MPAIVISVEISADDEGTRLKIVANCPPGCYTEHQVNVWMELGFALNAAAQKVGFDGFDCMAPTGVAGQMGAKGH